MDNELIASHFDEMAELLEIRGESTFRVRAYRNGAKSIRDLTESVASILADPNRKLTDLPGIGDAISEKCKVLLETGKIPQLEELRKEVPAGLLQIMRVPGLGAKKAKALYESLNITNIDELRAACEQKKVRELKGFAAKTEESILKSLDQLASTSARMLLDEASYLVESLRKHLQVIPSIKQLEFAGSYRRGKETVGDLDIVIVSEHPDAAMDQLNCFPRLQEVLARGDTKMSIRVHGGFQVDMRVVPAESFGAAMQYFTGSKEHNVEIRGRAKKLGLRINEYGVYREEDLDHPIAGETEESVYAAVQLPWIAPELRESRGEFEMAEQGRLPQLITLADLRGDLHMHTTATDGENTLEEMVAAAQARGWEYIAITDHSQRVSVARGLDGTRLRAQWQEIDRLNEKLEGRFWIFKGIECDILEKGGMDLPDDVLAEADWVLASVHFGQQQSREQITDRILGAIRHPSVSCVAHPTGRLLGRRPPYEVDLDAVMQAAQEHGKLLELNSNPSRLDLHDIHCQMAAARGIPLVINSDAHSIHHFDLLKFGILTARRAQLEATAVWNTLSCDELKKRLANLKQP
ncbi:MAG: DNA polymerase/3'-5' exonuclease PolX [Planctomycetaceae bacterium]|nr:DNA polymerase/3'-5' exonuclease PolX [Planctomycetaceae bacterium]